MLSITKIQLKDLLNFVQSEQYLSLKEKPISLLRVESYLKNPNASKDDFVLYMAFIDKNIVGYRTIFSDVFYYGKTKQKFGWLSGNWVHPKHRRKNISTTLFNEVNKDWNNQLMYSNYAEESKLLYDKTKNFEKFKTLKGIRYYRKYALADLLPPKNKIFKLIKPLLIFTDWLMNFINKNTFKITSVNQNNIQIIKKWDSEIETFLSSFKEVELFKRDVETYKWIINNPWIRTDIGTKQKSKQYYFSSYSKIFKNDFYTIKNNSNQIIAIINISIRNKQLKIPYFYSINEGVKPSINLIYKLCENYKISYLTVYSKALNTFIKKQYFLKQKEFTQKYFATKKILKAYPNLNKYKVQTGDGDSVFT